MKATSRQQQTLGTREDRCARLDADGFLLSESRNGLPRPADALPLGKFWPDYWHAGDRADILAAIAEARTHLRGRATARAIETGTPWDMFVTWISELETYLVTLVETPAAPSTAQLRLEAYTHLFPGPTWTADASGAVDHITKDWSESRGRKQSAAFGMGWLESVAVEDRERVRETWRHSVATGEPYKVTFRGRTREGTFRWQMVYGIATRDENQAVTGWTGISIDVDDQRRAIEQHDIFRSLAEFSGDHIGITKPDGTMLYLNGAGREMLGLSQDQDIDEIDFVTLFVPDDRTHIFSSVLPAVSRKDTWTGDLRLAHRTTGAPIPVACNIFSLKNAGGHVIGTAIVASDIRERQRFEQGLQVLAASGPAFIENLDRQLTLRNIATAVTDHFATFCVIDILDGEGEFQRIAFAHRDRERDDALDFRAPQLPNMPRDHFIKRTLLDGEASVAIVDDAWFARYAISEQRERHLRGLGFDSVICVPIRGQGGTILGALSCGLSKQEFGRFYDKNDLIFAEELARRAGLALSNARMYERELRIALTFQEQALPTALPEFLGLHLSAAYRPGKSEARIGGDWYDAFPLNDGRIAMIVGDVIGNGLRAAAVMNRLRQAMQTAALITPDPNFILDTGDRMLRTHDDEMYATALVAIYDPATATAIFASAGHPGPLVVDATGRITQYASSGLLLGLRTPGADLATASIALECGATLFLYTDGIIEISRDSERGQRDLESALLRRDVIASEQPANAVIDAVLAGRPAEDDIAVFALRIDGVTTPDGFMLSYHDVDLAHGARQLFMTLLSDRRIDLADPAAAELVFGELLGNVARHAPGPVGIEVAASRDEMILTVIDGGSGYELSTGLPTEMAESNRGLFLVRAFARDIRVEHVDGKTRTSVRLDGAQTASPV